MAGYSGTPLEKKLGIKEGCALYVRAAPSDYLNLFTVLPARVTLQKSLTSQTDIAHLFTKTKADLDKVLRAARTTLAEDAVIWISWPKKSSGVETDLTEDVVRAVALPLGLVDVKVCAVDETWSGLKLVVRKALRRQDRG